MVVFLYRKYLCVENLDSLDTFKHFHLHYVSSKHHHLELKHHQV